MRRKSSAPNSVPQNWLFWISASQTCFWTNSRFRDATTIESYHDLLGFGSVITLVQHSLNLCVSIHVCYQLRVSILKFWICGSELVLILVHNCFAFGIRLRFALLFWFSYSLSSSGFEVLFGFCCSVISCCCVVIKCSKNATFSFSASCSMKFFNQILLLILACFDYVTYSFHLFFSWLIYCVDCHIW